MKLKKNIMVVSKKTKSLLYNFISFAVIFFPARYIIEVYGRLSGLWIPFFSFIIATFLSPKFQAVMTKEGEKLYMKWPFVKGVKEIK
jgi:hypothetical protein